MKNYLLVLEEFRGYLATERLEPTYNVFPSFLSFPSLTESISSDLTSSSCCSSELYEPRKTSHRDPSSMIKLLGISIKRERTRSFDLFTLLTAGKRIGKESKMITKEVMKSVNKRSFFSLDLV